MSEKPMATLQYDKHIPEIVLPNSRSFRLTGSYSESDCILIYKSWDLLSRPKTLFRDNSVLFYPSAGYDLLTPTIVGLPFCTTFYFYECSGFPFTKIKMLQQKLSLLSDDSRCSLSEHSNGCDYQFTHDNIVRNVYWVRGHNKSFLEKNVNLSMYFHRGDSPGEGGSGEYWDSEFLPQLARMANSGTLRVVTQGQPGGINSRASKWLKEISINNKSVMHRDGLYFIGEVSTTALGEAK